MISKFKNATSGSKRMLIIVGIVVVGAVVWSYLSVPEPEVNPSSVTAPPIGSPTIQGGQQVTPAYGQALSEADNQRIEEARASGGSAIPTVRANTSEQILPVIEVDEEPSAEVPTVELPVEKPPVVQKPITNVAPIVRAPTRVHNPQASQNMQEYLVELRRGTPLATVVRFPISEPEPQPEQTPPPPSIVDAGSEGPDVVLPLAGTVLYAEMTSRSNSDAPGPVLARILQGEYAGATLIGSFETARDALVISFDRMTIGTLRDGTEINETIPISAIAVDTSHIGTALSTSVNRHLFQKLAIGFTATFAKGFGDALANNGKTTVITDSGTRWESHSDLNTKDQLLSAGGSAVSTAGDIMMEEFGRRPTTVIVESGTPVGILFL